MTTTQTYRKIMTLEEIKSAVLAGKTVCWENEGYEVRVDSKDKSEFYVICLSNESICGLCDVYGKLVGSLKQFFIQEPKTIVLRTKSGKIKDVIEYVSKCWVNKKLTHNRDAHFDYCQAVGTNGKTYETSVTGWREMRTNAKR